MCQVINADPVDDILYLLYFQPLPGPSRPQHRLQRQAGQLQPAKLPRALPQLPGVVQQEPLVLLPHLRSSQGDTRGETGRLSRIGQTTKLITNRINIKTYQ